MSLTLKGVTDSLDSQFLQYGNALEIAGSAFEELENLFFHPNFEEKKDWTLEAKGKNGEIVYSKHEDRGKIITVRTEVPVDKDIIFNELWGGVDKLTDWNPNIEFAQVVATPTKYFDIINYGNKDIFMITGREMLIARVYREIPGGYLVASRSIQLAEFPEKKDRVRAEVILGGLRIRDHPSKPGQTLNEVIMLADAKGMLPKYVVNQVTPKIALKGAKINRERFLELAEKAKANVDE